MRNINRLLGYDFLFLILYRLALDWHYFVLICPRHGLTFRDNRSLFALFLSWGVLIVFYFVIKKGIIDNSESFSSLVIYMLFLVSLVPFTTCIYAGMASQGFIEYNVIYWMTVFICWRLLSFSKDKSNLHYRLNNKSSRMLFILIGIIAVGLIVYVSWKYAHFRIITNLFDVYDIREEAASYDYPSIISYLLSWTVAINPLLLGVCFVKKKWFLMVICFVVQMLSFGIDGRKSTFFMPFLVIGILVLYKRVSIKQLKNLITAGVSMLTCFGIVEYYLLNTTYISDFGIRRVLIVPNQLGEYYYDFFTSNVPDYFRSSFLRHFGFQSPYQGGGLKGFTYLIADRYFEKPDMNANNGLASDGLANLGIIGCVIMPILLVVVLRLFDRSTCNLDKRLLIIVAIYITYNLVSTTLMTCLLTHGMIVLILVLPLIENGVGKRKKRIEQYGQGEVT